MKICSVFVMFGSLFEILLIWYPLNTRIPMHSQASTLVVLVNVWNNKQKEKEFLYEFTRTHTHTLTHQTHFGYSDSIPLRIWFFVHFVYSQRQHFITHSRLLEISSLCTCISLLSLLFQIRFVSWEFIGSLSIL